MEDRSVQAEMISQSVVVTGDGNSVSLRFGDTGIILPVKRKQFQPPDRRQMPAPGALPRELDLLIPEAGKLSFVGREDLLAELRTWLDDEPDISVHALIGRAGTGKTRLALELCKTIDSGFAAKGEWIAGFISPGDLAPVVETLATHNFAWERQTLLVIDYAAQCHSALARWLDRLAYQKLATKLRFLLLEREAPENFGWWHELTAPSLRDEQARLGLFYAPRPRQLPDLSDLEERRGLMTAAFAAASALRLPPTGLPGIPAKGADTHFDSRLADHQFGNPLNLVMAGVIARDRNPHAALALRRLDAARKLGTRELYRLAALAESRGLNGETMRYIVAFNGLAGGLPLDRLRHSLADELAASQRVANLDVLVPLLEQELFSLTAADVAALRPFLGTIQPDLIGEAAIIEAFTGSPTTEAEAETAVRRTYTLDSEMAAQALVRLVQDFGYAVEDKSATEAEKKTGERVMDWLLILAREIKDPVQLIPLVWALPAETTILREAAAELTERLAAFFRQQAARSNDPAAIANAARWVNNFANRLRYLGRREDALATAEEAVRHYRALAGARPDAFTPDLAMSLNNFAAMLSDLGRREDALAAAEEAVRHYRAVAETRPDAFTPDLAASLNNLAAMLSDLGRREGTLAAGEEAVRLYRALAEARPDAFTPDLALSLNNLANRLGALGRREDALAAAEEAVRLYRALAKARPDAIAPYLAASLITFANSLSALGRREEALVAGEEAVRLYRALAEARPDAFTPDLALSLNNLANRLGNLGRREAALGAAEEAVRLRRALAKARPDAFTPDLASSLNILANSLSDLGRREEALAAIEEAVCLYGALTEAGPDAFTPALAGTHITFANTLSALGRRKEALAGAEEAVRLWRALAEARPDAFTPDLAISLNSLAIILSALERREDALAASEAAIRLYRALAEARPDAFTPDLALSLNNFANRLGDLGRRDDALAAIEEAVRLRRALAQARPDAFTPDLAMSLGVLGSIYKQGNPETRAIGIAGRN